MSASRRPALVALTLLLIALLSSFAWSEERAPRSRRVENTDASEGARP